jgi:hypothetical protein
VTRKDPGMFVFSDDIEAYTHTSANNKTVIDHLSHGASENSNPLPMISALAQLFFNNIDEKNIKDFMPPEKFSVRSWGTPRTLFRDLDNNDKRIFDAITYAAAVLHLKEFTDIPKENFKKLEIVAPGKTTSENRNLRILGICPFIYELLNLFFVTATFYSGKQMANLNEIFTNLYLIHRHTLADQLEEYEKNERKYAANMIEEINKWNKKRLMEEISKVDSNNENSFSSQVFNLFKDYDINNKNFDFEETKQSYIEIFKKDTEQMNLLENSSIKGHSRLLDDFVRNARLEPVHITDEEEMKTSQTEGYSPISLALYHINTPLEIAWSELMFAQVLKMPVSLCTFCGKVYRLEGKDGRKNLSKSTCGDPKCEKKLRKQKYEQMMINEVTAKKERNNAKLRKRKQRTRQKALKMFREGESIITISKKLELSVEEVRKCTKQNN